MHLDNRFGSCAKRLQNSDSVAILNRIISDCLSKERNRDSGLSILRPVFRADAAWQTMEIKTLHMIFCSFNDFLPMEMMPGCSKRKQPRLIGVHFITSSSSASDGKYTDSAALLPSWTVMGRWAELHVEVQSVRLT